MSTITSTIVFYVTIGAMGASTFKNESYLQQREYYIQQELRNSVGGCLVLTASERLVNETLMKMKEQEVIYSDPVAFNFSRGYVTYKDKMRSSPIYNFLKRMPKGALLHAHSTMLLDPDDLLELTYEDHLYVCFSGRNMRMLFSDKVPRKPCNDTWHHLKTYRNATFRYKIDRIIKQHFSMTINETACDSNANWRALEEVHLNIRPLVTYEPVFDKYVYKCLQRIYDDNLIYAEIRTGLHELYKLNGKKLPRIHSARIYDNVIKRFKETHPDFIGVKLIITANRFKDDNYIESSVKMVNLLKTKLPHLIAGFDLVGQEDLGKTLFDLLPALNNVKKVVNFYFHGGETNWSGTKVDENLFDAILLGTKRIGHGFALVKHPTLMKAVKKNGIAVEVNVISNDVLCLVKDIRNHPLAELLGQNMPVVLSSDDPGVWDADPLTSDFFVAFLGVASKRADLRMLKQLALNSIKYSSLDNETKVKAYEIFDIKWKHFLMGIISSTVQCDTCHTAAATSVT